MPMIRQATSDDLEALTDLRVAFFEDLGEITDEKQAQAFWEATYRYLSEALPRGKFLAWVAEEEGQIVGTSGLIFFEQAPTPTNLVGNEGYVLNMYTVPPWRGRGIARTLLEEIIRYVKHTGTPQLWLYATEEGRPVYEKFGFVALTDAMGLKLFPAQDQHAAM
jgi:GNAT superfamily N-acetyltransferase